MEFCTRRELINQTGHDVYEWALVVQKELSVQQIYSHLEDGFYNVLHEIHGKNTDGRAWGHKLFARFPLLARSPPQDFVSRCMDHLAQSSSS